MSDLSTINPLTKSLLEKLNNTKKYTLLELTKIAYDISNKEAIKAIVFIRMKSSFLEKLDNNKEYTLLELTNIAYGFSNKKAIVDPLMKPFLEKQDNNEAYTVVELNLNDFKNSIDYYCKYYSSNRF